MKLTLSLLSATWLAIAVQAPSQVSYPPAGSGGFVGSYALADLPACNSETQGKFASVPDLGGGPGLASCNGSAWSRVGLGRPAIVNASSGTVTIKRLANAPIQVIKSNPPLSLSVVIDASDLQDGDAFYFRKDGLLTGTIGLSLSTGGVSLPILGNSSLFVVYSADCGCLRQIQ